MGSLQIALQICRRPRRSRLAPARRRARSASVEGHTVTADTNERARVPPNCSGAWLGAWLDAWFDPNSVNPDSFDPTT